MFCSAKTAKNRDFAVFCSEITRFSRKIGHFRGQRVKRLSERSRAMSIIITKGGEIMLQYCVCPKCGRMIMLEDEFETGFCCCCGTHIAFDDARSDFLSGLKASVPDELALEADLSELIDEDEEKSAVYGLLECEQKRAEAQEFLGKWDFGSAFVMFSEALDRYPEDFESRCGLMTAGILRLKDTENWEMYLSECIDRIRSRDNWNMTGKALEYILGIMKKFLSKGGRYVSPSYTIGFWERLVRAFPEHKQTAAEILAHCLNVENAPFTDAARLDHETTKFAVGNAPAEPDKNLSRGMLLVLRCHCDLRVKEALCRALYVYDRAVWLRAKDYDRINDALNLCETVTTGAFSPNDVKIVISTIYDFLMMGGIEQNAKEYEKITFLKSLYSYPLMRRMERFFSSYQFFWKLFAEVFLSQKNASLLSPEYKRIKGKQGLAAN